MSCIALAAARTIVDDLLLEMPDASAFGSLRTKFVKDALVRTIVVPVLPREVVWDRELMLILVGQVGHCFNQLIKCWFIRDDLNVTNHFGGFGCDFIVSDVRLRTNRRFSILNFVTACFPHASIIACRGRGVLGCRRGAARLASANGEPPRYRVESRQVSRARADF